MSHYKPNLQRFDPLASKGTLPSDNIPLSNQIRFDSHVPDQLQYLQSQGYSSGMIQAFLKQKASFPTRIWILDNSAAMNVRDAHIVRGNFQNVDATRWEELQDCVAYHADLAARFGLATRYALLNRPSLNVGPQYFSLHQTGNVVHEQTVLNQVLTRTQPNGPTPITAQLNILRDFVCTSAPELRARNQLIPIVLATQGLPTDEAGQTSPHVIQQFVQTLQSFEQLPVWFVFRMCTDDEKTFEFYNSLDAKLDIGCDVLDDFYGEALEVYLRNPWLTYGLALHRYRETGNQVPVLDEIDERALTLSELRDLCYFLFNVTTLPDPAVDWYGFIQTVKDCLSRESSQWNPVTKSVMPWINLPQLDSMYGRPSNVSHFSEQPRPQFSRVSAVPELPKANQTPLVQGLPPTDSKALVEWVSTVWAKNPPEYHVIKPVAELLGTVGDTFALVEPHEYFHTKFQPFSKDALHSGSKDVLQRAVRKMRLFLHPDKLPKDFNVQQLLLCKTLWDSVSESWNAYSESH
jgi:hypothetical protein